MYVCSINEKPTQKNHLGKPITKLFFPRFFSFFKCIFYNKITVFFSENVNESDFESKNA